jgi:hypothetical protein
MKLHRTAARRNQMKLDLQVLDKLDHSFTSCGQGKHITATCLPRGSMSSASDPITSIHTLYIQFKPPGPGAQSGDRPQALSPQADPCQPCVRCDAGETGPYDVGNMQMHSRFPNSGLGKQVSIGTSSSLHIARSYIKQFGCPDSVLCSGLSWCNCSAAIGF